MLKIRDSKGKIVAVLKDEDSVPEMVDEEEVEEEGEEEDASEQTTDVR